MAQPQSIFSSDKEVDRDNDLALRSENQLGVRLKELRSHSSDLTSLTAEMKQLHQNPEEYWFAMGCRLEKILNDRIYRLGGYRSFSDYCKRALGYSRQHVYKLIKVARFIEEQNARAITVAEQQNVLRLFNLGFTKLYLLHVLPAEKLTELLQNGLILSGEAAPLALERAKVGQIKRALNQKVPERARVKYTTRAEDTQLINILNTQARMLLRFIAEYRAEMSHHQILADTLDEHLHTIEQCASAIAQGISALNTTD